MDSYSVKIDAEFKRLEDNVSYLVIMGIDKIPPHIGFIDNGKYFSESSRGGKFDYSAEKLINALVRKNVKSLFVRLDYSSFNTARFFNSTKLGKGDSCLSSIKLTLKDRQLISGTETFLFDILENCTFKNNIIAIYHLNCDDIISNKNVFLQKYGQDEIDQAIEQSKIC
ncbi:MAG: hypothetical protein H6600_01925 [Flavobacteriales bacterium]|nr:hypothetical protein [Flavobacteriales bacterium]